MLKSEYQEMLRRFTLGDERIVARLMCGVYAGDGVLDDKTRALVCLAGLLATEPDVPSLHSVLDACQAAGAESDEMLGVIEATQTIIGSARAQNATASIRASLEGSR